jgi:hypothetical protein
VEGTVHVSVKVRVELAGNVLANTIKLKAFTILVVVVVLLLIVLVVEESVEPVKLNDVDDETDQVAEASVVAVMMPLRTRDDDGLTCNKFDGTTMLTDGAVVFVTYT